MVHPIGGKLRLRTVAVALIVFLQFLPNLLHAQTSLRKIGELELQVQGISATVQPANPTIPKNTAAGVRIVVSTPSGTLTSDDVAKFVGGSFEVHGELSGPGLSGTITLPFTDPNGGGTPIVDPLILPIPPLAEAGDYTLSNLRITVNGSPALDVSPSTIPVKVIDQVLITSVSTRPLTLDEIKAAGIVLDSNDFLGFQFTIGLATSSNATTISFPVVFDHQGVPIPQPIFPPGPPTRDTVPVPTIIPVLLNLTGPDGVPMPNEIKLPGGGTGQVRIPSVLVIPGNVGFLKQFFSAQLYVSNGTPGGSGLVVHDLTGKINLPPGDDAVLGTADDPLALPTLKDGPEPDTKPVLGVGPDGQPGTSDDVNALNPGDQAQAEFIVRGDKEGFHQISFDIKGVLDGLVTGPVNITGSAQGGVLVRNPFFDLTFAVPGIVRNGEQFKVYVTVKNISQSTANLVKLTLDSSRMSGATLLSAETQTIDTIAGGGAKTLTYLFKSLRTGQVVASYLHFDTQDGSTGELKFTLGVGERGVPLSPDTLVLPSSVANLPQSVVDAAMLVLGEGWSIANAPAGSLPANVLRTSKAVVTQKALALAEAGLRVGLGQPVGDAVRDLLDDFYGGNPVDPGFDQLLRTTQAGQDFERAVGAALAQPANDAGGPLLYQQQLSQIYASGPDFLSFVLSSGTAAPPVAFKLTDGAGNTAQTWVPLNFTDNIAGFAQVPLGNTDASPILALLTEPNNSPYTLELTGRSSGTVDLAVTMPRGDGTFLLGQAAGVPITAGLKSRIVLDPSQPNRMVLEQDTAGDGSYSTQQTLSTTQISPTGAKFISATVIGPETLPGASPLGVQMAMLFDRIVDATSAQDVTRYQIPSNAVQQARSQLSGRIVLANLAAPEGPYVPTTVAVSGLADQRGVTGPGGTVTLQSRLQDAGAVVSGRVFNSDGTPVGAAVINYSGLPPEPNNDCQAAQESGPVGFANIPVNTDGRYEIRYVWQNPCGPFQLATTDPNTGGLRSLSNFVRTPGEHLIMDIALFGRGSVTGTVRDLLGNPVPGAAVVVLSQTDVQIGAQTTTDGDGHYSVSGVTVGPVSVQAGKGNSLGRAAGTIPRAGNSVNIDVTLDSGSLNVSGVLQKEEKGVTTPVSNWPVVYSLNEHPGLPATPVAVVNTDVNGNFTFTGVPTGNFIISSQLTAIDRGSISGFATANQDLTNQNLTIVITDTTTLGTANGKVTFPDGSAAAGAIVYANGGGVLTNNDGTYSLPGLPISPSTQRVNAITRDGTRSGSAAALINQSGEVLNNVNIVLSGLGTAQFTIFDSTGKPVSGQNVALLGCSFACGCNAQPTATDGTVKFTGMPVGQISAIAVTSNFDVATATASITGDGITGFGVMRFAGTGTVTGNVIGPDGTPVFGADIVLSSNVFDQDSCSLVNGVSQRVQTDQAGNFKFTNVKVGRVSVTASQVFFPTQVGAQGALSSAGQTINFNLKLVNTISGVFSGNVFLPDGVTPAGPGVEVTANGPLPDVTVKTDASSHFTFAKIFPEGTYTVTVRDPISGGVAQEQIFLRAGQDMAHDFRLKGRGTVTVQVVDGSNLPVDSAFVTLTENTFPNSVQQDAVQPANQGIVTFQQVFEGPFSVEVFDTFGRGGRASSILPHDGDTVNVIVQLTHTGTVQGHFLMPDHVTTIPFGSVKLIANGRQLGQVTTDGSTDPGSFKFTFVPAGPVRLEAQDPVTARTGVAAGTIDTDGQVLTLDVIAEGLGTVTGLVTSNSAPEPGSTVDIFSGNYHAITVTDSTGHYLISGVPEGHIVATASLQNGFLAGSSSGTLTGDGTTLNLDVALRGSGALTGQVLQADGVTPASASLVTVQVGGQGGGTQSVTTDLNGNFSFPVVPAGTASLTVTVLGSIDEAQTSVEIQSGTTVNTTVRLNGIGSISGRTLDSAGNPIAAHAVIIGTGAFGYSFSVDTNSDGTFFLPTVLAGTFTVSLSQQVGSITLFGTATSSVLPNKTTSIDVQVQPSGSVTGKVFRSDGVTPAAGSNISISLNSGSVLVQAQTDGTFTAHGIPLGGFSIRINDPVSTGQALLSGLSLTTNGQVFDTGNVILNDTPMSVVSIDPGDGSTGVPVNQSIKIAFTDALQSLSGISFTANGRGVFFSGAISADGKLATFTGPLPDSAQITVTVSTSVSDIFGRHPAQVTTATFQTVDLTPPSVTTVVPVNGTIQVASNSTITVNFSEPLAGSTNLANLIVVNGPTGAVAGTTVLVTSTQAVFTPAGPLPANGTFNVTVNGETDPSGNVQTVAYNFSFFTVDTIAPVVQLVQPPNGAFTTSARPSISFSATDALTGVNFSTATVTLDGQPVASGTLSFTPAANLAEGAHTTSASVADRAGNVGTGSGSFVVDTQPPSAAVISGISEGQVLKGAIPVTLSATDATSGVALIDLLVDGNVVVRTTSPFQLSLNSASISDGNHTLTARATDVAGNVGPQGPAVHVIVDNVPLTVSFTSPAAGAPFNSQFTTTATTNKATQRVDFTFAGQVISSTSAPFTATFSVASIPESTQVITAQAFDFAGNSASATRNIVVDRTPPLAPNVNLINAEPPIGGFSQVHGLVGSVEAFATLKITNTTHPAQASVSVAADGTFSTNVAGSIDDALSLVAVDAAGNASPASVITVRQTSSLPPATGNTSLNYAGDLVDRVGTASGALTADGNMDAVFTIALNIGDGITRTLSRIDLGNGSSTHSTNVGSVPIGIATDLASPFLNHADGTISLNITSGATLTLVTADSGFIQPGMTFTATAFFTDGSRFVGTFLLPEIDDQPFNAHSATIVANPPFVVSTATSSGTTTLTITNIRDVNGTLVPDGKKIALSVANGATRNGYGDLIPSAGGTIVDGVPAANNASFKVFTIIGGTVTATYSGQPVSPSALTGSMAVVQMIGADASGNVLGTEVAATQDINLHPPTDRAVAGATPASIYADTGDHRSHVIVQIRDAAGNPVPDGTRIAVSAASNTALVPGCCFIGSAGGTIIGGTSSPSGSQYRVFTTTSGSFELDYSDAGLNVGSGRSANAFIAVMNANADNSVNNILIGSANITLVGPAQAEMSSSMSAVPVVSTIPVTINIHHLHDTRGNLVPDGATVLVSAQSNATLIPGCCFIGSAGGTIVDGLPSPNSSTFRYFTLASSQAAATYTTDGISPLQPGASAITNIQIAMGDPAGRLLDNRLLKLLPITLVAPTNAVGNAQPAAILGDGGIHTATVTFKAIIDTLGNTVPDGTKVAVSTAANATLIPGCCFIGSAGGQILSGVTAPNDSRFQIHTVTNGGITVSYADQNVIALPGQILTANIQMTEARADNTVPTQNNISTVAIKISGLTSATVTSSPRVLFADGSDYRATVTVSNLRDAVGNLVPDGTLIAVSAAANATLIPGCCFIGSAGGVILGGTPSSSDSRFQIFVAQSGQIVFQYSSQGVRLASGQQTANIQIAAANFSGAIISSNNIGNVAIQLLAPGSATLSVSPVNVFADGGTHTSAITVSNLKDSDGVTPVPDGARIGMSVANNATLIPGCCFIGSAGGQLLSAGTTAGDGIQALNNTLFNLFTVVGNQVLATYADAGIASGVGQTQTANVQVVPVAVDGSVLTTNTFAVAPISLRGINSTTASGPGTLSRSAGSVTITYSGIKDTAGNLVPDGTLVAVSAVSNATLIPGCCFIGSVGGTIVDGSPSPSSSIWKLFVVQNGTVTVTYSPAGAGIGTANIQMTGAKSDGTVPGNAPLSGGIWSINITN